MSVNKFTEAIVVFGLAMLFVASLTLGIVGIQAIQASRTLHGTGIISQTEAYVTLPSQMQALNAYVQTHCPASATANFDLQVAQVWSRRVSNPYSDALPITIGYMADAHKVCDIAPNQ